MPLFTQTDEEPEFFKKMTPEQKREVMLLYANSLGKGKYRDIVMKQIEGKELFPDEIRYGICAYYLQQSAKVVAKELGIEEKDLSEDDMQRVLRMTSYFYNEVFPDEVLPL